MAEVLRRFGSHLQITVVPYFLWWPSLQKTDSATLLIWLNSVFNDSSLSYFSKPAFNWKHTEQPELQ